MNLIEPSVAIWNQHLIEEVDKDAILSNLWAHIARCTRVCYQSEKRNCDETEEEFVKRVILAHKPENSEANHLAMLEHGTVYLKFYDNDFKEYKNPGSKYAYNKYSNAVYSHDYDCWYVTTNLRVLVEHGWLNHLQYICSPTEHHAKRVTVSFITNIGVTREFNRHRVDSIAEESTRYCNYSKKNNGELNIGLPAWILDEDLKRLNYINNNNADWLSIIAQIAESSYDGVGELKYDIDYYGAALYFCNICYNKLIERGWTPQKAREVLPLATKSQLIHTAFVDDWKHFFKLRAIGVSGAPHPNAKLVAVPLMEEFINKGLISKDWNNG